MSSLNLSDKDIKGKREKKSFRGHLWLKVFVVYLEEYVKMVVTEVKR